MQNRLFNGWRMGDSCTEYTTLVSFRCLKLAYEEGF